MSLDRRLAAAIALVLAYSVLVVGPLHDRLARASQDGSEEEHALRERLQSLQGKRDERYKQVAALAESLRRKQGLARVTASADVTLDSVLEAVHHSASEAGGTLRSATPLAVVQTKTLELQGLQCTIDFPGEEAMTQFLKSLQRADRAPYAMLQQMTFSRQEGLLRLDVGIGLLRTIAEFPLEEWAAIGRTAPWPAPAWLLDSRPDAVRPRVARVEAPPPPPPSAPPPPAPVPPPPPPPAFDGRLLGAGTSAEGKDYAVFEVAGAEHVVGLGEKVSGWVLLEVHPDRAVLENAGRRVPVWFTKEQRPKAAAPVAAPAPAEKPAPPAVPALVEKPAPAPAPGAARLLGLRAVPVMVSGQKLPSPFEEMRMVYSVVFVSKRSIAERSGLRPGDRILAIDGAPLQMDEQLVGLRTSLAQGKESQLAVERGGMVVQVAMVP